MIFDEPHLVSLVVVCSI